jgi:hypothetical protein
MTTTTVNNRSKQQAADQKLVDGLNKHAPTLTTVVIGGTPYKPADIIAILQARLAAANTVQSAKPSWQNAVKAEKDERAKTKSFVSGLRQALAVAFAGSIDALADFGLAPRKARVVSPEKKAAAALKAKATRAARHTMGTKQKAAIKGTVPTTAPATAAPAAAPIPVPAPAAVQASPTGAAPATPATKSVP